MNKGFSLVELIVVIAIMAILVGVAVPVYTSYISKAKESNDIQAIDNLDHACQIVAAEYSVTIVYASVTNGITATITHTNAGIKAAAIEQLKTILGDAASVNENVFTVALNTAPNVNPDDGIKLPSNIN